MQRAGLRHGQTRSSDAATKPYDVEGSSFIRQAFELDNQKESAEWLKDAQTRKSLTTWTNAEPESLAGQVQGQAKTFLGSIFSSMKLARHLWRSFRAFVASMSFAKVVQSSTQPHHDLVIHLHRLHTRSVVYLVQE